MLNRNEGPRGGFMVWLMAVIVVSLAAKVDTTRPTSSYSPLARTRC